MSKRKSRSRRRKLERWFDSNVKYVFVGVAAVVAVSLVVLALNVTRVPVSTPRADRPPVAEVAEVAEEVPPRVVSVIGDSYTAGSAENSEERTWVTLLPSDLNVIAESHAVGGVGYSRGGENSFPAQAERIRADSDLVIIFGSRNDSTANPDATYAEAARTMQAAQAKAPDATLVAVGFPWPTDPPSQAAVAARDALARAAADSGAHFVDALTEGWLLAPGLIGSDGVHPTDAGVDVITSRMADIIRSQMPTDTD